MADILEEASAVLQCKTCPWYKNCVTPMRVGPEDMQKQFKSLMGMSAAPETASEEMRLFLESAATTLQNVLLEGCPVFISRLRQSPRLAQSLKQVMQAWGQEIPPPEKR
ncbi:MAG: hypothetical protein AB1597_07125 [Chloroflexota bacterium]